MLWSLALLAPFSLLASDLPGTVARPLAIAALLIGFLDARRHGRLRPCALVIPMGRGQPTCDGKPMQALKLQWRGTLGFLRWRDPDGHIRHLAFWPDTLPAMSRRELRLAAMRMEAARENASVAR